MNVQSLMAYYRTTLLFSTLKEELCWMIPVWIQGVWTVEVLHSRIQPPLNWQHQTPNIERVVRCGRVGWRLLDSPKPCQETEQHFNMESIMDLFRDTVWRNRYPSTKWPPSVYPHQWTLYCRVDPSHVTLPSKNNAVSSVLGLYVVNLYRRIWPDNAIFFCRVYSVIVNLISVGDNGKCELRNTISF